MTGASEESILQSAAVDGSLNIGDWPRVLEILLQRLHNIVHSEFPIAAPVILSPPSRRRDPPRNVLQASPIPESSPAEAQASQRSDDSNASLSGHPEDFLGADKENAAPAANVTSAPLPLPQAATKLDGSLEDHPHLLESYNISVNALKESFSTAPPYTVQRLAELVLQPKKHYRYLPPYLAALERVISVSSPSTSFPLANQRTPNGILHLNGINEESNNLSGDEGLGGALLTPIPWLRRVDASDASEESVAQDQEGDVHSGGIETDVGSDVAAVGEAPSDAAHDESHGTTQVSNPLSHGPVHAMTEGELREQGAVTQGELLRQEQEAGVVPVAQADARRHGAMATLSSGTTVREGGDGPEGKADEDVPHARGPDEIGMEDLGPQAGAIGAGRPLDLQAALGHKHSSPPATAVNDQDGGEASGESSTSTTKAGENTGQDSDGDYVLVDAASTEP